MHVSKGHPKKNSTKIWLTKTGACILDNNSSEIPTKDLNKILEIISKHYFMIVSKWKEFYHIDEVKYYC